MKLLDQVRQTARVKHFTYRTEQTYAYRIERYIRFHGIRHPNTLQKNGATEKWESGTGEDPLKPGLEWRNATESVPYRKKTG